VPSSENANNDHQGVSGSAGSSATVSIAGSDDVFDEMSVTLRELSPAAAPGVNLFG
jgi:hypothetical protein